MSEESATPDEPRPTGRSGTAPAPSRDIFISYASQDAALADSIVMALEGHGLACWIAPRDVTPGEFYADAIVGAINATRVMVLVLTASAAASPHVLREVERASSKKHPVISLRIDAAPLPAGLEYFLSASHWLDATTSGVDPALPRLIDAVARLAAQSPRQDGVSGVGTTAPLAALFPRPAGRSRSRWAPIRVALLLGVFVASGVTVYALARLWLSNPAATAQFAVPPAPSAAAAPEKSIAVLPFTDMSEKRDQEFFSDGLSEELINRLTQVPGLRVPARTSSSYFKGKQTTISEIAKALGVAHVLEGSVRRSGPMLRVTAQLIRANDGYQLWSQTFDRPIGDVFKIQDEISNAVVHALRVSMIELPLSAGEQPPSAEAYTLYLQARLAAEGNGAADYDAAVERLRSALRIDPGFTAAWAGLALNLTWRSAVLFSEQPALCNEARGAAERALQLGPGMSEAHRAMAIVLQYCEKNLDAAEAEMKRALELHPGSSSATQNYAWIAIQQRRPDLARQLAERAVSLDPLNSWNYEVLGSSLGELGRLADAEVAYRRALELNPTATDLHVWLAVLLLARHQPAAALEEIDREPNLKARDRVRPFALDAVGRTKEADEAIHHFELTRAADEPEAMGEFYACRHDADRAMPWLERAVTKAIELMDDPLFLRECLSKIASDPRYKALQRKAKLPD